MVRRGRSTSDAKATQKLALQLPELLAARSALSSHPSPPVLAAAAGRFGTLCSDCKGLNKRRRSLRCASSSASIASARRICLPTVHGRFLRTASSTPLLYPRPTPAAACANDRSCTSSSEKTSSDSCEL
ncbi:uncharacterized protein K460DRAFT_9202 [Cucurbitaria berberidis CBS 394.84]|uniref:Uncharacterized protein n=1 Tax=Cucurbitaria berberidis CBS 394.84 TaxID=1168544 RepID=A0A9P4GQP0_9PLEO|nr:uncharacterized protein K460DRAFT_9202 [Cucurbitaria berberidis CBS 394.84]KAF1850007.1 hypothetical protein K460DRAFT_9202 [Cucurbitaria berberidis CBS 394.84]